MHGIFFSNSFLALVNYISVIFAVVIYYLVVKKYFKQKKELVKHAVI